MGRKLLTGRSALFTGMLSTLVLLTVVGAAAALEAPATIKKVDAAGGMLSVFAGGQDRNVKVGKELKVFDADGKELPTGLAATELKEGAHAVLTVERQDDGMRIVAIRLGGPGGQAGNGAGPAQRRPGGQPGGGPAMEGKPTVGLKPLTEMTASDKYKGEDGGLYGGGSNEPSSTQAAAAREATAKIVPRDVDGQPASNGQIGLISISMSNATMEYSTFKRIADADSDKSASVTIVDCAQGGQTMARWADLKQNCWTVADQRLQAAGVSPKQVQVAWVKLANARPTGDLQMHGQQLEADTITTLQNARARFPNLQIAYLSSRIYGGWASTPLNPEPYAYEGALVVRWTIRDQVAGDARLSTAKVPLVLWGPYLWSDGVTPRKSDGLVWTREDLVQDGTHPSETGRDKVAKLLLEFFKTDANARTWFVKK